MGGPHLSVNASNPLYNLLYAIAPHQDMPVPRPHFRDDGGTANFVAGRGSVNSVFVVAPGTATMLVATTRVMSTPFFLWTATGSDPFPCQNANAATVAVATLPRPANCVGIPFASGNDPRTNISGYAGSIGSGSFDTASPSTIAGLMGGNINLAVMTPFGGSGTVSTCGPDDNPVMYGRKGHSYHAQFYEDDNAAAAVAPIQFHRSAFTGSALTIASQCNTYPVIGGTDSATYHVAGTIPISTQIDHTHVANMTDEVDGGTLNAARGLVPINNMTAQLALGEGFVLITNTGTIPITCILKATLTYQVVLSQSGGGTSQLLAHLGTPGIVHRPAYAQLQHSIVGGCNADDVVATLADRQCAGPLALYRPEVHGALKSIRDQPSVLSVTPMQTVKHPMDNSTSMTEEHSIGSAFESAGSKIVDGLGTGLAKVAPQIAEVLGNKLAAFLSLA